ncbi:acetyltransferase [Cohnella cellulosilytica]|uniref:Acetyltransferase n=1 Tax=Cohnella cellulosilytica TaxID=986710 RepID=A0ABW2FH51_9BACL
MSLKELIIVGAGSFGREVLCWARDIHQNKWKVKGFIDDNLNSLNAYNIDVPVVSRITGYQPDLNEVFVCAIAKPDIRLKITADLENKGAEFVNIIHPTSVIGGNNQIGTGNILCPYSVITTNVTIGNHVIVNLHSSIGHDVVIEDGVTLSAHCDITGFVQLEKGVFLGSGARLLPSARAEQFSVIGAGCVVLKHVKAHKTVFGVPARYLN